MRVQSCKKDQLYVSISGFPVLIMLKRCDIICSRLRNVYTSMVESRPSN